MQYVEPPNQILRYALIQGLRISSFAQHVGSFIAVSLFKTSALALDGGADTWSIVLFKTKTQKQKKSHTKICVCLCHIITGLGSKLSHTHKHLFCVFVSMF